MLLLLLSRFSRVWLCVTPWTAAYQASPSMAFSKQEHWSGLPFPSPMQESEKWEWSHSVVSDFYRPHRLQPTRLLHPWDFPGKSTGMGCHFLLQTGNRNIHIDNYLKRKQTECSNQKTQSGCTGTKTGPVYILPTRDSLPIYRDILKVMGCTQVFHEHGNQHKVDVEIIIWNKTDFKIKSYKRQKRTLHNDQKI